MNKAELVLLIQKNLGKDCSKACAEKSLNATLDAIKAGVKKSKAVQLIGFGTFKVATRSARMGRNPQTGKPMKIKAAKTVRFVAGKAFKKAV